MLSWFTTVELVEFNGLVRGATLFILRTVFTEPEENVTLEC
jgi:hypothetical protein